MTASFTLTGVLVHLFMFPHIPFLTKPLQCNLFQFSVSVALVPLPMPESQLLGTVSFLEQFVHKYSFRKYTNIVLKGPLPLLSRFSSLNPFIFLPHFLL